MYPDVSIMNLPVAHRKSLEKGNENFSSKAEITPFASSYAFENCELIIERSNITFVIFE
jgi:hypothetical protein